MKKYFLFFNLFLMVFMALPVTVSAAKKYRYIKREHGVRFQGHSNIQIPLAVSANFQGAYTYNWKGMFEVGPYFSLDSSLVPFSLNGYGAGLMAEYNIIKNRGKRKFIPAVGLKFGVAEDIGLNLSAGLYTALKFFVGTRTPFTVSLGYNALTPMTAPFTRLSHQVDMSMGFSYYFDFY